LQYCFLPQNKNLERRKPHHLLGHREVGFWEHDKNPMFMNLNYYHKIFNDFTKNNAPKSVGARFL